VDLFLQSWIDPLTPVTETATADAGYGWNMTVSGTGVNLRFAPDDMNLSFFSNNSSNNKFFQNTGFYYSSLATFTAGETYTFSSRAMAWKPYSDNSTICRLLALCALTVPQ
jgi:hypothetical protein